MLGNADEMIFESFRLNKLDRQHGQAGGFIGRGGNYLTPQPDMRTASRREQPYYSATSAAASQASPAAGSRASNRARTVTRLVARTVSDSWGATSAKVQRVFPNPSWVSLMSDGAGVTLNA
ncbi:hypothetical protein G6F66_015401 [Rhizopus arrhizus]|nr:hypothetical protein G6F66_015401 [Rhizopus arrhizus]